MTRSQQQISDIMRRVKGRDTAPELAFRKALWAAGLRYRLHVKSLPGKPDILVRRARLAIFVDGDFWHGNQWRSRGHSSIEAQFVASPRADYWVPKIDRNMRRDRINTAKLLKDGWQVLRFWETDVKRKLEECVEMVLKAVEGAVAPSPLSRLPAQTAFILSPDLEDMAKGLESAGWCTSTMDGLNSVSLVAGFADVCAGEAVDILKEAHSPVVLLEIPIDMLAKGDLSSIELLKSLSSAEYYWDLFALSTGDLQRIFAVGVTDAAPTVAPSLSLTRPRQIMDIIASNPNLRWSLKDLPPPLPPAGEIYSWLGDKYLNPMVTDAMHSRLLRI